MQLACIAPAPLLELTAHSDFHMMLPGPFKQNTGYADFYAQAKGWKLLDNGIAEAQPTKPQDLFRIATVLNANEIVVPDVLGDWEATVKSTNAFAKWARMYPEYEYMAVAQGQSHGEMIRCLDLLMLQGWVTCIGVPRILCKYTDDPYARVRFMEYVLNHPDYEDLDFHALGAHKWIAEIKELSNMDVRSMDSSLPFVMGVGGLDIRTEEYIERQPDFFERGDNPDICKSNVEHYRFWAKAEAPGGEV